MNRAAAGHPLRVVVVGDFQIGKSSLVNCLLADSAAETGEGYFPTTDAAAEYPFAPGVVLVDTPGYNDANPEMSKISDGEIRKADAVIFVKTETTLGARDKCILRKADRKPTLVCFNCTDATLEARWIPSLAENTATCDSICSALRAEGLADSVLAIDGRMVTPINILWAQVGLEIPVPEEKQNAVSDFAQRWLHLSGDIPMFRKEMLQRSGFLPIRDFMKDLPLELLKDAVSDPQREIDRMLGRFVAELKKRWSVA